MDFHNDWYPESDEDSDLEEEIWERLSRHVVVKQNAPIAKKLTSSSKAFAPTSESQSPTSGLQASTYVALAVGVCLPRMVENTWQESKNCVLDRIGYLIENDYLSDVEFVIGSSQDTQIFRAHKLILSASSPVFEAMFYSKLAEKSSVVIPDIEPATFRLTLRYLYTDVINFNSVEEAYKVCYVAKKYLLHNLVKICSKFIWSKLDASNVCTAFEFSQMYDDFSLLYSCIRIMDDGTDQMMKSKAFLDIRFETLKEILKRNSLSVAKETIIFESIIKWAEKECSRKNLPKSPQSVRKVVVDLLKYIRFMSMTPKEFAEEIVPTHILTHEEIAAILVNLASFGRMDLPETLNGCEVARTPSQGEFYYYTCIRLELDPDKTMKIQEHSLGFCVDRNIWLCGVTLFNKMVRNRHHYNSESVPVNMRLLDEKKKVLLESKTVEVVYSGNMKFDYVFSQPVYIFVNSLYEIWVHFDEGSNCEWRTGRWGQEEATSEGVRFSFFQGQIQSNGTTVSQGQFANLLFYY